MANELSSVRVKIDRAKHHLAKLEAEIAAFHDRNPYRIITDTESEPGEKLYRFQFVEVIPVVWAGAIGDVVHNLRSALDNLATALVIHSGHTSKTALSETYFPIGSTEQAFEARMAKCFNRATTQIRKMVKELKPYKTGTIAFWQIHQLDILDKHTTLIPVGVGNAANSIRMPIPKFPGIDPAAFADIQTPYVTIGRSLTFPLKDGDILMHAPKQMAKGMTIAEGEFAGSYDLSHEEHNPDIQFTLSVSFGEGQIVDGLPVVPTLKQFVDFIEGVGDIFAKNVFNTSW